MVIRGIQKFYSPRWGKAVFSGKMDDGPTENALKWRVLIMLGKAANTASSSLCLTADIFTVTVSHCPPGQGLQGLPWRTHMYEP